MEKDESEMMFMGLRSVYDQEDGECLSSDKEEAFVISGEKKMQGKRYRRDEERTRMIKGRTRIL